MHYKEAENWVFAKLAHELEDVLIYHDIKHTADVVRAADRLCYLEGVSKHDTIMVRTAALFHDIGFCEQYMDNEELAAGIASEMLPQFGYSPEEVATIGQMILATRVPHHPYNKLDEIICDADLDYLGRDDFHPIADSLKVELMHYGIIKTDKQWDEIQVKFFNLHRYFTPSAIRLRQVKKAAHLQEIKSRLSAY
ncbi:MAG: phosphohydrolase [Cryomorphaceae bacterium]|nr:MAG: phosphohydrolase [Cryomorphaceae bacterium]